MEERIRWLASRSAKRLKGLEQENVRLKRVVADLSLDNSIGGGKLLSPARRREAVQHAVTVLAVSKRRACRVVGQFFNNCFKGRATANARQLTSILSTAIRWE